MEPRTTVGIALTILSGTLDGSISHAVCLALEMGKYLAGLFDFWNASDTLGGGVLHTCRLSSDLWAVSQTCIVGGVWLRRWMGDRNSQLKALTCCNSGYDAPFVRIPVAAVWDREVLCLPSAVRHPQSAATTFSQLQRVVSEPSEKRHVQ